MNWLKKLWYNYIYFFNPPWDTGISPPELLRFLDKVPPGKALDIGCGTGTNVVTLAKCGWQATGVDFVRLALRKARQKATEAGVQAEFKLGDVTELPRLVKGKFDLALDMGCFHGLDPEEKQAYIKNLQQLMAPGGYILLYGFLGDENRSRPDLQPEEIVALTTAFELVDRQDTEDGVGKPSVWLTLRQAV